MLHRKVIGGNLRRIRKSRGWSQERLSDKSGLDQDYVGRLERGQVNVSTDTLAKVCAVLGVDMMELFKPIPEFDIEQKHQKS
jgi:XRE family transcriptional regulator, regulator of sulfur utilization